MGDQHLLAESLVPDRRNDFGRYTRQIAIVFSVICAKSQWNQSGPALADLQSELPRQFIAKGSRTHLRNRQPAGRDHQRRSMKLVLARVSNEVVRSASLLERESP